ncbi:hypothetical protein SAMN05444411_102215 [Lutibacter oricola]|uniref:Uncharacterized protein n=1 Tax=Lutibacter oricola TaxID=762486 RepID=A0A1H2WJE6_9FLAO|nr:hypothetical protein SAMN05444411_102215 [Lutibacter oricola]
MPKKGQPKNTRNKAKHSKLMNQKKAKLKAAKDNRASKLQELKRKISEKNNNA